MIRKIALFIITLFGAVFIFTLLKNRVTFNDLRICASFDVEKRNSCWFDKAVLRKDPSFCNNLGAYIEIDVTVSKEAAVRTCKAVYGGRIGDQKYCLSLGTSNVRGNGYLSDQTVCMKELANYIPTLEQCDKLPTNSEGWNIRNLCYIAIAEKQRDMTICERIPETPNDGYRADDKMHCRRRSRGW